MIGNKALIKQVIRISSQEKITVEWYKHGKNLSRNMLLKKL